MMGLRGNERNQSLMVVLDDVVLMFLIFSLSLSLYFFFILSFYFLIFFFPFFFSSSFFSRTFLRLAGTTLCSISSLNREIAFDFYKRFKKLIV